MATTGGAEPCMTLFDLLVLRLNEPNRELLLCHRKSVLTAVVIIWYNAVDIEIRSGFFGCLHTCIRLAHH